MRLKKGISTHENKLFTAKHFNQYFVEDPCLSIEDLYEKMIDLSPEHAISFIEHHISIDKIEVVDALLCL